MNEIKNLSSVVAGEGGETGKVIAIILPAVSSESTGG